MESLESAIRASGKARTLFSPAVTVADRTELSLGYTRIALTGGSLAEYRDCCPADGLPAWEVTQPVLRALTVRSFEEDSRTITTDIARHDHGVLAQWLQEVVPGDVVKFRHAVSRGGDVHEPALAERVSLGE
ncbi:siderophore-interacting protein [Corynebacterium glyciniphilum]|uniref:siderophore-interacting protein n=1 Tax=Corynebacterium glyciniphilum TaxID=1404244 RepID=UPI0011AB7B83|nr:siderophore-interacting protein [Corynebacterium glyciniphilum]